MISLKLSLLLSLSLVNAAKILPKLSNGNDAQIAEFPFLVSIQEVNVHIGHGSLLNEKWILSSARLLAPRNIDILNIEYGNTVITPGPTDENNARISQIILHEEFNIPTPRANDICLVESGTPIIVNLHESFAKIIIPGGSKFLSGTESVTAGWGHIRPGSERTNLLQKANLRILSSEQCTEASDDGDGPDQRNICAIGESVICIGDLGGPLLVNGVIVGIASFRFGPQCESVAGKYPNVYTDISYYTSWIERHTDIDYQLNMFLQRKA